MAPKNNLIIYLSLVLAAIFWGANFHFAKIAVGSLTPVVAASYRFILASALLIIILFITAKADWGVLKRYFMIYTLLAFFGVFGYNILFFTGMKTSSTVTGALINATNPLMTVLISGMVLKTTIKGHQIIGIVLSFVGILGVISKGDLDVIRNMDFVPGDLLIMAATLLFGFFNVYTRKYLSNVSPVLTTTAITSIAALMFLTLMFFGSDPVPVAAVPTAVWGAIAGMSVFGSVIAYTFWNRGLNRLGADKTSVFMNLVPLSAAVISIFIGETLTMGQIIGGAFIITGVVISSLGKTS